MHIPFPQIERLRHVVKTVGFHSAYIGKEPNGEPIYDFSRPKPKIQFTGTVKLHGTNGGVSWSAKDGIYAQSREIIITPENDNDGFARFVQDNRFSFVDLFDRIKHDNLIPADYVITIFGEWAGRGVMKGMGISQLEKSFFIFGVKVTNPKNVEDHVWADFRAYRDPQHRIFNILDYSRYSVEIDFEQPDAAAQVLNQIIEQVETECPVAKAFGLTGLGEGVVFIGYHNGQTYRFKAKGEKHEVANTKERIEIAPEVVASHTAFAEYAVGIGRVGQAIQLCIPNAVPTIKDTGAIVKWVCKDVLKEEADVLTENGFEWKDVQGYVSAKARSLFHAMIAEHAQLTQEQQRDS